MDLHGLLRRYLTFLHVDDILTSREKHQSQKTHIWSFKSCYGDIITLVLLPFVYYIIFDLFSNFIFQEWL
jgi:hypothetical protein